MRVRKKFPGPEGSFKNSASEKGALFLLVFVLVAHFAAAGISFPAGFTAFHEVSFGYYMLGLKSFPIQYKPAYSK
jgi:hypothetical protein